MKFTVITVVKNNNKEISKTINSVKRQSFKKFEYIIVDGKSNDGTSETIRKNLINYKKYKHIIKKDRNLYQALNYGIKLSKGKYIIILHAGDIFWNSKTLKIIDESIADNDAISGNVFYQNKNKLTRAWNYPLKKLNKYNCFKVAHTALIIKKNIIKKLNYYNTNYKISSDTDFIFKLSLIKKLKYKYINKTFAIMAVGGLSNSYKNYFRKISEDLEIYYKNFKINFFLFYLLKLIYKFFKLIKRKKFI
tara:strand:+ start:1459 stop:2205 length:747 start_codon:yes stop_codon:yes gene_type:complete